MGDFRNHDYRIGVSKETDRAGVDVILNDGGYLEVDPAIIIIMQKF